MDTVKAVFKNFPDLSFAEYYHMSHLFSRKNRLKDIIPHYEIGAISVQFIQFYKHCPDAYILSLDDNYFENHDLKEDFNHIRFIHQENLVEELSTVLKEFGFQTRDVDFLKEIPKINVTRLKQKFNNRQVKWFSQELIQNVLERDRLIFHLFPEYLPGAPAPFGFNQ